jgi:LmbE family N-acetylglucosaminyl deacetylase/tetratricopeptide (TPR) repeat protein
VNIALILALVLSLSVMAPGAIAQRQRADAPDVRGKSARVDELTKEGEQEITEKAFGKALATFGKIAALSPHDKGALIRLADLYSWMGDYDRSIALYREIIGQDTLNLAANKGLARVMRWASRASEAESIYDRVLSIEPDDLDALSGLAVMCAQQRDLSPALQYINRAARVSPKNLSVLLIKGDILTWSNRYSEAEQVYQSALEINPSAPEVYRSLGDLYKWSGRYGKSLDAFRRAHKLDPRNADYLIDMTNAALASGSVRDAENAVKELFSVVPDDPRAYKLLREIESRNEINYVRLLQEYVKPFSLIASIVAIAAYFRRRKDILERRHRYYWRLAYQVLPSAVVLFIVAFVVLRQGGFSNAEFLEGAAELLTFLFLISSFFTLVWVSRMQEKNKEKSVLAVGAHPDDLELGCGATLAKFKEMGYKVYGMVVTGGEQGNPYTNEKMNRCNEARNGARILGLDQVWVYSFKDTELGSQMVAIKNVIEEKIRSTNAEIIITQSPHDLHQDHRTVFEATKIAARGDKTLLCYEDVSTEAHFVANFFIDITEYLEDKIVAIQSHRTQRHKRYMDPENIRGRAAHRGLQSGVKYAEAFLLYKGVDTWTS